MEPGVTQTVGFGVPAGEQELGSSRGWGLLALLLGAALIDAGKHGDG